MTGEPTLAACRREIEGLHDFFVSYYTGETADGARLREALADDFEMVAPGGAVLDRAAVLAMVEEKANSYDRGNFDIEIRNVELVDRGEDYAVCRYEEHQSTPEEGNSRVSTVLFHVNSDAAGELSWQTVHETRC